MSTLNCCNNKCTHLLYLPFVLVLDDPVDLSPPEELSKAESLSVTSAPAVKQSILPQPEGAVKTHHTDAESSQLLKDNLTEKAEVEVMDAHEQGAQTVGKEWDASNAVLVFLYICLDHAVEALK